VNLSSSHGVDRSERRAEVNKINHGNMRARMEGSCYIILDRSPRSDS